MCCQWWINKIMRCSSSR